VVVAEGSCAGCNPVNIPLPLQVRLLEASLLDEWQNAVAGFIAQHHDEIVDMAFQRHANGFATYHSTMYGWSPRERTANALEEISDCLVYLSSGEVE